MLLTLPVVAVRNVDGLYFSDLVNQDYDLISASPETLYLYYHQLKQ